MKKTFYVKQIKDFLLEANGLTLHEFLFNIFYGHDEWECELEEMDGEVKLSFTAEENYMFDSEDIKEMMMNDLKGIAEDEGFEQMKANSADLFEIYNDDHEPIEQRFGLVYECIYNEVGCETT